MRNGSVVETDTFGHGDREQYTSMHTEQGRTPSEMAGDVLTVGCWILQHCPCLQCQETLKWQHDGHMNVHGRHPLKS